MRRVLMGVALTVAMIGLAAAAGAAETPAQTTPTTTTTSTTTTTAATSDAMDEIVCRRMQVTGQLLPGPKVCRTRRQWLEMQRQSQQDVQQMQDASRAHSGN